MLLPNMSPEQRKLAKEKAQLVWAARFKEFEEKAMPRFLTFFKNIPERYKKSWLDCFEGKANKRKAIAAKCYECAGYEDTANNVGKCTARQCPLWQYRPKQKD